MSFHATIATLFLLAGAVDAADLPALSAEARQRIEQAIPAKATVPAAKPRRLLIFTRNQEYQGHAPAIAASCVAFTLMGKKTGAFETTVSDDPAVFERASLKQYDAVFLNNTLGATFTDAQYRENLLEFVTSGGGLMGVHGTVIAFTKGRVFYTGIGNDPEIYEDARMLQFHLDAAQFVLGDLSVPTTPSAKLTPAVLAQEKLGWRIGVEAYTFHKYTFFETIEKTAALGLPYIGGLCSEQPVSKDIPKDFDQNLTDDELRQIRMKMESAGVRMLTYYVRKFPNDEAACRKLFEFANKMGAETFMGEPKPEHLELLDKLANEYGINIAIHNHDKGISPIYWRPENVLKACEGRSKRIGACPDVGYWLRSGIDPIKAIRILKDRILMVHLHDLHETGCNGHDVPWGTGIAKSAEFLRELHRLGAKPTMIGIEYAHDWHESMPKIAKCIEFFNETTLQLAAQTSAPNRPATSAKTVRDADGNIYHTVKIGDQVWTVENLRTTKFNDGSPIPQITDKQQWKAATGPAFCYFDNKPENVEPSGLLYNWFAASSPKIAPKGWRVPTREEQLALRDYLISNGFNYDGTKEGNKIAKAMSVTTGWPYKTSDEFNKPVPDLIGMVGNQPESNNRTGYSAKPAGSRWAGWGDGAFHSRQTSVYWWSVTPHSEGDAYHTSIHTWFAKYGDNHHTKTFGFSIRLIQDTDTKDK
jgi:uncharacterized protein (TIGR02145 family)